VKPAAARRVERELREIMRRDGDNCSICRAPFVHNTRTYGGITKAGVAVLVSECCHAKVAETVLGGLFLDSGIDDLATHLPTSGKRSGPVDVEKAVTSMQGIFASREAEGRNVMARAGVKGAPPKVFRQQTDWKTDDAAWFETHRDRSHRLRPLIGDEAKISGFQSITSIPPRHETQVLVRQVAPGQRMRLPFVRNLDMPIPDNETALHALFDIASSDGGEGEVISTTMLRDAVGRYAMPKSSKPS